MARTPNPMGRSRRPGNPYIVTEDPRLPGWRWEVLKTYQVDGTKPYARAFVFVTSPMTGPGGDLGDSYVTELGRALVGYDIDIFPSVGEAARALWGAGAVDGIDYAVDLREVLL
jgi:hypothetical protein